MAAIVMCSGRAWAVCPVCSCTAGATGVAFGVYQPSSQTLSTGKVTVSCLIIGGGSGTVAYSIDLSQGSGSYAVRDMLAGLVMLNYNLYTSSADSAIWGDGTSGTSTVSDSYTLMTLTIKNYTVYGAIPASQNIAAGSYNDTIMVTVNY